MVVWARARSDHALSVAPDRIRSTCDQPARSGPCASVTSPLTQVAWQQLDYARHYDLSCDGLLIEARPIAPAM